MPSSVRSPPVSDEHWADEAWWQTRIDEAVSGADPVICNLRITLLHRELSLALNRLTGPGTAANFHTWAVWGSKTAGRTIRRDDLPFSPRTGVLMSAGVGASATGALAARKINRRAGGTLAGGALATGALSGIADHAVDRAAGHIFEGNATVLDDIGRQSARLVSALIDVSDEAVAQARLEEFLAGLRPGPAVSGGQDLLRGAYRHYYDASREHGPDRRDELMLCANLLAILHEHQRLEPYINESVPRLLRKPVTKRLLSFSVGGQAMRVSADVPGLGASPFPTTLATIEDPELRALLDGPHGWDRTPDSVAGSAAADWTKLSDRMNFIVDLFRTRQDDPNLFTPPYSPAQCAMILAGQVPDGPL